MRGLIIGFGSIGKRHAENLRRLQPNLDLLVLRRGEMHDPVERAVGSIRVQQLDDALRAELDFAIIANPSSRHVDVLVPLLEAGVACYVEKPVVTTPRDLERVEEVLGNLKRAPVTLVGCNLRFLPSLKLLRQLLVQGKIGQPVRASLQAGQWLPDWRPHQDYRESYCADSARGGGVIFDLIHEIDAARWLLGEFEQVRAMAGKFSQLEIATEDTACILLGKSNGGPIAAISLDYVSRQRMRRYEIVGDAGTLAWDLAAQTLELITPVGVEAIDAGAAGYDVGQTYLQAMTEFLRCVREGLPTSQELQDGLHSTALALRARESAGL